MKSLILCCEKIRDKQCIGCERCLKASREKLGKFSLENSESVEIVGILSCGGCPGLFLQRIKLFNKWIEGMDDYDVIFIGNCVKAMAEANKCSWNIEDLKNKIEEKFGKKVIVGTHPWA